MPGVNDPRFVGRGRVLVFQPRPGMGDLIWHLPVIRAVAAASPSGRVTLLTKRSTQADALLEGDPAIERIVWFDRNPRFGAGLHDGPVGLARLVATLRGCRANTCVLLHHGASLAATVWLAGIPNRYGYGFNRQDIWLNRGPRLRNTPAGQAVQFGEAFDQATAFAQAAGLWPLPEPHVALRLDWVGAAGSRLAGLPRPLAVLGIGAHGADRQWGPDNFAALARALRQTGVATVLLACAEMEGELAGRIAAACGDASVHQAVGWSLGEVAGTLAQADMFVGNDSGLLNLRAALGRSALGLFGASGPLRHSTKLHAVIPPLGPRTGMAGITVAKVMEAIGRAG